MPSAISLQPFAIAAVCARLRAPQGVGRLPSLRAGCAATLLFWALGASAAEAPAVLTLLEGAATLVLGARAYAAVPGARLGAGAIVETDAQTRLLRLEWPDGSLLDLGASTRVMLRPSLRGTAAAAQPLFYLLQGWAKQTQTAAVSGQLSPAYAVLPFKGALVSQVDGATAVVFSESGGEQLAASRSGGAPLPLRAGQAAVWGSDGTLKILPRPPEGWLAGMPRAFRDTLPARATRFPDALAVPEARTPLTYAALQHWLVAEPELRRDFPTRFGVLLSERAFRSAVNQHLGRHPEWQVVLRPPRAASAARSKSSASMPQESSR